MCESRVSFGATRLLRGDIANSEFGMWNAEKSGILSILNILAGVLELFYLENRKEQFVLVVGAACSRDHLISRLQAAPTVYSMVIWTLWIRDLSNLGHLGFL